MTKHDPTLVDEALETIWEFLEPNSERQGAVALLYRIRERNPLVYDEALRWCAEELDLDGGVEDADGEVTRLEMRVNKAAYIRDCTEATAANITPTQTESDFLGVIRNHVGPLTEAEEAEAVARFRQGLGAFGVEPEVIEEGLGKARPNEWTGQLDTATGGITIEDMHRFGGGIPKLNGMPIVVDDEVPDGMVCVFNVKDGLGVARFKEEREGTKVLGKGHWTPLALEERIVKFAADTADTAVGHHIELTVKAALWGSCLGYTLPALSQLDGQGRVHISEPPNTPRGGSEFVLFLVPN